MKPTKNDIIQAVRRMHALAMFPNDQHAREEIMRIIERMVGTKEQLDWLVSSMIDRVGEWKGPREMRGIFCTRFKPLDGIESYASAAGFTPADSESLCLVAHSGYKRLEAAPERKQSLLPVSELDPPRQVCLPAPRTDRPMPKPLEQIYPDYKPPEKKSLGPTPIRTEEERRAEIERLRIGLEERQKRNGK